LADGLKARESPATFTVGLVTTPCAPSRVDELMRAADALLYRGKEQGKNVIEQRVLC
jgi:PleD family two-component response regulator